MVPRGNVTVRSVVVSNMEEREREAANSRSKEKAMKLPSEPDEASTGGDDSADKVDVCSDNFDPLLALYSPSVPIPCPNVKCFNNVAEYESFLRGGRGRAKPANVEKKRLKAMKGVPDLERIERLKKLMVNNPVADPEEGTASGGAAPRGKRRLKPQKNVLTRMPLCKGSPLGELFRCVEERVRVKVHIRTFKGLRGVCSGFVVAFDKFWNLAMVDVDETYREPLLGEAVFHEKTLTITRLFEKLKLQETPGGDEAATSLKARKETEPHHHQKPKTPHTSDVRTRQDKASVTGPGPRASQKSGPQKYGKVHTRHVNQLFIRGENVILVNPQPV